MLGDLNQQNASGTAPGGYGGGGYGPPPGGGGYAPPPGGGAPPGAPGGYGPPPGAPPGGVPAQPAQPAVPGPAGGGGKKSPIGLIIGLVVGLFALGGIGYAAYWFFGSSGPVLAKYAPKDTQIYVEVPSMSKALLQLAGTDIIDSKELEPEAKVDDMVEGLSNAFDISKDEAKDIIKGVNGIAFIGRDMKKKGDAAVLISFSTNIEKLLKSKRFNKGDAMHGAATYEIEAKDIDIDKLKKMSPYEKSFSRMSMKGDHDTFAWVESKKLVIFGDKDLVEDATRVVNGDKDALTTSDTFKAAKYESGSAVIAYIDPEVVDEKDMKKDFFDGVGAFTGSMRFASAGMVTTLSGQLKGKKLPEQAPEPAGKLDMSEKLPADTIGYIAFSTKSKLSGKDAQEQLVKSLKDADKEKGKQFEKGLDEVEKEYGVSPATFFDAIGDQAIIAVTASEKLKLDKDDPPKKEDILDNMGAVFAVAVKDKKAAEKLVKTLREEVVEKLGKDMFDVEKKEGGFTAKPKDDKFPMVKVVFEGDFLIFAVGKKERVNAILDGFKGEGKTLKDDKAHKKAMSALNTKPQVLVWLDTGRFMKAVLDDKDLKDALKEQKVPYKALKVDGDDRMTSALAIEVKVSDGTWNYKVEGLNIAGAGALGGLAALARLKGGGPSDFPDMPSDPGGGGGSGGGSIGVPECDQYLTKMEACISKMPASAQDSMRESLKQSREAWAKAAALGPSAQDAIKSGCQSALDSLSKMPMCN